MAGPIFTLNFLGQRVFVLNSHKVVSDMLEKNMKAYAGRPVNMVMASELYVSFVSFTYLPSFSLCLHPVSAGVAQSH